MIKLLSVSPLVLWTLNAFQTENFSFNNLLRFHAQNTSSLSQNEWTLFSSILFSNNFTLFHALMTSFALYISSKILFKHYHGSQWFILLLMNLTANHLQLTTGITLLIIGSTAFCLTKMGKSNAQSFITYAISSAFIAFALSAAPKDIFYGVSSALGLRLIDALTKSNAITIAGNLKHHIHPLMSDNYIYKVWKTNSRRNAA